MYFTKFWFDQNIKNWEKWLPKTYFEYLEIGSYEGRSATWVYTNRNCTVDCVDPFINTLSDKELDIEEVRNRFKINIQGLKKLRWYELTSTFFFQQYLNKWNVIYVDGDHSTRIAIQDIISGYNHLKPEGLLIIDDYEKSSVKLAVDYFLEYFKPEIIHIGTQVCVKNIPNQK